MMEERPGALTLHAPAQLKAEAIMDTPAPARRAASQELSVPAVSLEP